jgi:hypothetical protein
MRLTTVRQYMALQRLDLSGVEQNATGEAIIALEHTC